MSIGNDMKAIAENLKNVYGAAFIRGRDRGYDAGYAFGKEEGGNEGYTAGMAQGEAECRNKHFAVSLLGSGKRELRVAIPFKPHVIAVFSCNSYSSQVPNSFKGFLLDLRSCGRHAGNVLYCVSDNTLSTAMLTPSAGRQYTTYQEGIFSFELPPAMFPDLIWPENVRYTVTAVQYPQESIRELLQEEILSLPDTVPPGSSGTLRYYRDYVYTYISLPDWEALTAKKPNWTFEME